MSAEWVRQLCLSFPNATEAVQWGNNLVFKIGGKMFAVLALEPGSHCMSFKCAPEEYSDLIEKPGIVPAPYLARAQWVALETPDALPVPEIKRLLLQAYQIILAKLPKRSPLRRGVFAPLALVAGLALLAPWACGAPSSVVFSDFVEVTPNIATPDAANPFT